jgi:hypothetical protein
MSGTGQPLTKDDLVAAFKDVGLTGSNLKNIGNGSGTNFTSITGTTGAFSKVMEGASEVLGGMTGTFTRIQDAISPQLDTWRGLTSAGVSFKGGLAEMAISASGARVSSQEFAETLSNTSVTLRGLGKNSKDGADGFAKLTQDFYGMAGVADGLRNLGYTNKELNDILAYQVSVSGPINLQDEAARKKAIASATQLAEEMDLQSKLTGQTRKEQMEVRKEAQMDAAYQSKLRAQLLSIADPVERAKVEREANEAYVRHKQQGDLEAYREMYVLGTVYSEKGKQQVAMLGDQARATGQEAQALARGEYDEAKKFGQRSREEAVINASDIRLLQLGAMGDLNKNTAIIGDNLVKNSRLAALTDKYMTDERLKGITDERERRRAALNLITEDELKGIQDQKTGKGDAATTDAALKAEQRKLDIEAAAATGMVAQANRDLAPTVHKLTDNFGLLSSQFKDSKGTETTKFAAAKAAGVAGYKGEDENKTAEQKAKENSTVLETSMGLAGKVLREASDVTEKIVDKATKDTTTTTGTPVRRAGGSPGIAEFLGGGSFNKMFESFGTGTPAILHGEEMVATKEQINQIIQKAQGGLMGSAQQLQGMVGGAGGKSTLDDIVTGLDRLNSSIMKVVSHIANVADNSQKQVKATKSLSNNMYG